MSDTLEKTVVVDGKTVIIYNNLKADLLQYSDLYIPSAPVAGSVIPSVNSIIVKEDNTLWRVTGVHPTTYESTLVPVAYVLTDGEKNSISVISYDNDVFKLYIDKRTDPYKLVVDSKLLFFGTNLKDYILVRYNDDGTEEIVSAYYDASGTYVSDRVPMTSFESQLAYKYPTNCHTLSNLEDGEQVSLRVYNNVGTVSAEITIVVKEAGWFNDVQSHTNPIVEFNVDCLQTVGDDFYINAKQDVDALNMLPYVIYADGTKTSIQIDKMKCFVYGLEDFVPDYPGRTQTLIFKYFLNASEKTTLGVDKNFLTCTKQLTVVSNYVDNETKISVIPLYNASSSSWYLRYFAYTTARDAVYDITDLVTYSTDLGFDGTKLGFEQHVEINFDLQSIFNNEDTLPGVQSFRITVKSPEVYERYLIRSDDTSTHYFGVDGSITRRPIIHHDAEKSCYFIPTSIFGKVDDVIESFYTLADPLYNTKTETKAPTPTHFLVRSSTSGRIIVGGAIPIENYGKGFNTLTGIQPQDKETVIVEFIQEVDDTQLVLFGVPVDIVGGMTYQG